MMRKSSKFAVIAAITTLVVAASSTAYTPSASKWDPRSLPISYVINSNSAPASLGAAGAISAVNAGFATWSAPACTTWRSNNAGSSNLTRARTGDSEHSILWIQGAAGSWPGELGAENSTIGVTTPVWRNPGYFIDADIQFNAVGFRWGNGSGGTVDTQSIAVHEEGHFLGLDHTNIRGAVMFPSYSGGQVRNLNPDDQAGVCFLYPSGMAIPDSGMMMMGGGGVGDVCSMASPCADGNRCVCRSANDCFCSRMCSNASPCPNMFQCVNTNIGQLCVPGGGMMMGMGTGRTGDPCTGGGDCSTGVCVRDPMGQTFCSQVCSDDCSCPNAFHCVMTSMAGTSVCAQGNNTCAGMETDSGVSDPDTGIVADVPTVAMDASVRPDGGYGQEMGGCRCSTPGQRSSAPGQHRSQVMFALAAAMAATLSTRRNRRRN